VAAFLIGYTGDITRFASGDHYAAYNGTAPIEVSSGGKKRHRLSLRGNRRLNHAIHMAAVTQIRFDTPSRVYYDKKLAEGKSKNEALRALKRRISDAVYRRLVADQQRTQTRTPSVPLAGRAASPLDIERWTCSIELAMSIRSSPRTSPMRSPAQAMSQIIDAVDSSTDSADAKSPPTSASVSEDGWPRSNVRLSAWFAPTTYGRHRQHRLPHEVRLHPGQIQVTPTTRELLARSGDTFEPRGTIDVNGKGSMET